MICCVIVLAALVTLLASPSARWGCVMMAANWLPVAPEPQPAPREDQWWQDLHDQFVEELEQADKGEVWGQGCHVSVHGMPLHHFCACGVHFGVHCYLQPISVLQGYELLFYGDSITEAWRGTNLG